MIDLAVRQQIGVMSSKLYQRRGSKSGFRVDLPTSGNDSNILLPDFSGMISVANIGINDAPRRFRVASGRRTRSQTQHICNCDEQADAPSPKRSAGEHGFNVIAPSI